MIVSTTKYHPVFPPKFYPFYITSTNCIYSSKGLFASPFLQLQKRSPLYSPLLTQASVITVNTDLSRLLVNSIVSVCVRHDILSLYLLSILQCWKFLSSFFILQQKKSTTDSIQNYYACIFYWFSVRTTLLLFMP